MFIYVYICIYLYTLYEYLKMAIEFQIIAQFLRYLAQHKYD